jgi:lysophospholipase L1-like esterase
MRAVAAKARDARPGVVLHVGDSITYASPYAGWARAGRGRTAEDLAALRWMHAGAGDDTDGWHLATFDHPDGGRSHTACGGIQADQMLAGGKQRMPSLSDLLARYRPQAVVLMLGTNDASAGRKAEAYRNDIEVAVDMLLARGVVPILSTIPPHVHRRELADAYNAALRAIARERRLPLIDFEREILDRRPDDWDGTLLNKGDVHPSAARAGVDQTSAPTPANLRESGYLLRGWLSVKKVAEVKRAVFDAPAAKPAAPATTPAGVPTTRRALGRLDLTTLPEPRRLELTGGNRQADTGEAVGRVVVPRGNNSYFASPAFP